MSKINPTIFKAYDIRGLYPSEVNEEVFRKIGQAFVSLLQAKRIAVGQDMRLSSPSLASAFVEGARSQGADVVDYGLIGTDMLYYVTVKDQHDGGAEITASHNPQAYNGVKLVAKNAVPLSGDSGISDIRDMISERLDSPSYKSKSSYSKANRFNEYVNHVLSFIDISSIKPFHLVLDAGSGIGGLVAPLLFDRLPCQTTRLCFEVDGTFPNHEANPLIKQNRQDLVSAVISSGADAGIAWDGDADRCFFVDGTGEFISGDFVTALLAEAFLLKHPRSKIIYDVRASYAVKDLVARHNGSALMNRVGHAFFKKRMREEDAVFGGEVTGHYYFRDNFYADNGFIPALLILELMSKKHQTLRELLTPLREQYFISGEINSTVNSMSEIPQILERLKTHYADGTIDCMDGVSIEYDTWHCNVRPSNTEPLIRLNLEGNTPSIMATRRDEIIALIRSEDG